jgi:hypothetical protein
MVVGHIDAALGFGRAGIARANFSPPKDSRSRGREGSENAGLAPNTVSLRAEPLRPIVGPQGHRATQSQQCHPGPYLLHRSSLSMTHREVQRGGPKCHGCDMEGNSHGSKQRQQRAGRGSSVSSVLSCSVLDPCYPFHSREKCASWRRFCLSPFKHSTLEAATASMAICGVWVPPQ